MSRSPNGINIRRFLEGYGVKVHLYRESKTPRPANVVYGGRQIGRLIKKDPDRAGLTIRCIQTSNPSCFDDVTVWSVWCFLTAHFPHGSPTAAIKAFSRTDLADVKKRAQRLAIGEGGRLTKTASAISILLAQDILNGDEAA
jgi:hypothetical protein